MPNAGTSPSPHGFNPNNLPSDKRYLSFIFLPEKTVARGTNLIPNTSPLYPSSFREDGTALSRRGSGSPSSPRPLYLPISGNIPQRCRTRACVRLSDSRGNRSHLKAIFFREQTDRRPCICRCPAQYIRDKFCSSRPCPRK